MNIFLKWCQDINLNTKYGSAIATPNVLNNRYFYIGNAKTIWKRIPFKSFWNWLRFDQRGRGGGEGRRRDESLRPFWQRFPPAFLHFRRLLSRDGGSFEIVGESCKIYARVRVDKQEAIPDHFQTHTNTGMGRAIDLSVYRRPSSHTFTPKKICQKTSEKFYHNSNTLSNIVTKLTYKL